MLPGSLTAFKQLIGNCEINIERANQQVQDIAGVSQSLQGIQSGTQASTSNVTSMVVDVKTIQGDVDTLKKSIDTITTDYKDIKAFVAFVAENNRTQLEMLKSAFSPQGPLGEAMLKQLSFAENAIEGACGTSSSAPSIVDVTSASDENNSALELPRLGFTRPPAQTK